MERARSRTFRFVIHRQETQFAVRPVDDVAQFFKTYYAPNNAVLTLVGDFNTKDALSRIKKNFDKIPRDRISLGSKVVLLDVDKNEEITYKLVTSEDANVTEGLISTTSPIGRSLLNKREGDTVEVKIPSGTRTFEILSFTTMYDTQ